MNEMPRPGLLLLERDAALGDLARALAAAASGAGSTILVSGEAGIGKTSLLEHFSAHCTAGRVLWGSCDALFTPNPLGPLRDIARITGGGVSELLEQGAAREAVFAACLAELERGTGPTLVVVEDVHWADEATIDLLKFLGRRIVRLPVLIALSYRDDELDAAHPLRSLLGTLPVTGVRRLPLEPLSASAVETLARPAGRDGAALYGITAGNPFFVTELLGAPPGIVPQSVRDAVLARAARLSGPARDVVEAVAVVPGQTEHWLLDALFGDDRPAVDAGVAAGVLRELSRDRAVAYRHELGRRAVEQSLAPERARQWHRRVLAALEQHGKPWNVSSTRMVHHAERAGDAAAVLRLAPGAARLAASLGSHRESAALLASALVHAERLAPRDRAELLEAFAQECLNTDRHQDAIDAMAAAAAIWRNLGETLRLGSVLGRSGRAHLFLGDSAAGESRVREAIALLETLPPGPELAMAWSQLSAMHFLRRDAAGALQWGNRAIELARELNDLETLQHALNNTGTARARILDDAGIADISQAIDICLSRNWQDHAARAFANMAAVLVERRHSAAAEWVERGVSYCRERDLDAFTRYILAHRAALRFNSGNLGGALVDAGEVLASDTESAISRVPALVTAARSHLRAGTGRPRELLDEALDRALPGGQIQRLAAVAAARAEAAWLGGDDAAARDELAEVWSRLRPGEAPWMAGELAIWLWRAGGLRQAPAGLPEPFALELAGEWRHAARAWDERGCPLESAILLALNGAAGDIRDAFGVMDRLGARGLAAGLRVRLKARGATGVPRGARRTTRANPAGLTNRQLGILRLLAEGRSNPEIAGALSLSPRTVDHHVSAILGKLKAGSRAEATALAVKNGWDRAPM